MCSATSYINSSIDIGKGDTDETDAVVDSGAATDEIDIVGEGLDLGVGVKQRVEGIDTKGADEKVIGSRCAIRDEEHWGLTSVDADGVEVDGREDGAQGWERTSEKREKEREDRRRNKT